jgi:hypothetical protein
MLRTKERGMRSFLLRLAEGRRPFHGISMGEATAPSHSTLLMALSKIGGLVEGNTEGAGIPRRYVAEKTRPGGLEQKKRPYAPPTAPSLITIADKV